MGPKLQFSASLRRLRGGGMCFGSNQNKTGSREIDASHVHCFFRVQVNNTMPGDTVLLMGGADVFGSWDSKKGLKLSTSSREFPW
jgi:hypothetical protein